MAPIDIWYIWPVAHPKDLICHQLGIITGIIFTYPLSKISIRQMLTGQSVQKVTFYTFHEGAFVLYRGVLPPIIQRCSSLTSNYYINENMNRKYVDYPEIKRRFLIGTTMASVDCLLMPFERVQVILADKSYNHIYRNMWHCFQSVVQEHGFRELYRGAAVVYTRNLIGCFTYLSIKSRKEQILKRKKENSNISAARIALDTLQGTSMSILLHPLNVLKVFIQKRVGEKGIHTHAAVREILEKEGIHYFFNGLFVNVVRSSIMWILIASSNETYKGIYARYIEPET